VCLCSVYLHVSENFFFPFLFHMPICVTLKRLKSWVFLV
jgi:hypothetical protein